MDTDARLLAIEDIKRLKATYCRLVDTKQWDALRELLTDDATMDIINPAGEIHARGRDDVVGLMSGATAITVHQIHVPEIDIESPTSARAVWSFESLGFADATAKVPFVHSYGHYNESYVNDNGRWRIASILLTRLHVISNQ